LQQTLSDAEVLGTAVAESLIGGAEAAWEAMVA
jgi:hypothetical protein